MNRQTTPPQPKPQFSLMSVMVSVVAFGISVGILWALAASSSTIAQALALVLGVVAVTFIAWAVLHLLIGDDFS